MRRLQATGSRKITEQRLTVVRARSPKPVHFTRCLLDRRVHMSPLMPNRVVSLVVSPARDAEFRRAVPGADRHFSPALPGRNRSSRDLSSPVRSRAPFFALWLAELRIERAWRHDATARTANRQRRQHVLWLPRALPGQLGHAASVAGRQRRPAADARGRPAPEMVGQDRDIFAGRWVQRWHRDADADDARRSRSSRKPPGGHFQCRWSIPVRRRDQTSTLAHSVRRCGAALPPNHPQHLRLRPRRELADLVEQERAAVRFLEHPDFAWRWPR